jgi:uncharacterized protein DUF4383
MPSDRGARVSAFGFAIFFGLVVVLGYIPGLNAPLHQHQAGGSGEHLLLGQYKISLIDDVTHGLTAVLLLAASLVSARMSRLALLAFGWYYAVDAAIFLITGVFEGQNVGSNIVLNIPHVVLSSLMLLIAYRRPQLLAL